MSRKEDIADWFRYLQDKICHGLEEADEKGKFKEDLWEREAGGGGRSRILGQGNIIEKGGVNFSAVHGHTPLKISTALGLEASDFFATGVSVVIHPFSPMVPIIHMNVRYFEMSNGQSWFGGGIDLTPHYVVEEDAKFFHENLKKACNKHSPAYYDEYKKWADDYFFIKHRKETRGIGGIFFDRLSPGQGKDKAALFGFVQEVALSFLPIYLQLVQKNKSLPFGEKEKHWQMMRRGRYVEFNLVLDKGTKFGLDTDGRTESILMSLPPQANWLYDYHPEPGSKEAETLQYLRKGIHWA